MSQTHKHSIIESCVNIAIGYGVALASQLIIFPLYGIDVDLTTNIWIGAWFTVISLIRIYTLRRIFNGVTVKNG